MINDNPIKKGIYKHFKGKLYKVLGEGLNTETGEIFVVYTPLYDNEYELFVRPKSMFIETLPKTNIKRFEFIRDDLSDVGY